MSSQAWSDANTIRRSTAAPVAALPRALGGRALALARAVWLVLALASLLLFTAGIPARYAELTTLCAGSNCAYGQLAPAQLPALTGLGLSLRGYAGADIAFNGILTLAFGSLALLIFARRSNELMALIASLWLVLFAASNSTAEALARAWPSSAPLFSLLDQIGWVLLPPLFLLTFPDGRFVPPWSRWMYLSFLGAGGSGALLSRLSPHAGQLETAGTYLWLSIHLAAIGSQVYRYRRVSGPHERQQTKWFVAGLAGTLGLLASSALIQIVIHELGPNPESARLISAFAERAIVTLAFLLIPVTLGFSIMRYRLWDIDLIANRALLYTALSAFVIVLYVLVVGILGAVFHSQQNLLFSILATGLIAVLFHPMRVRLQKAFNRILYGQRDEPAAVMAALGKRLESLPPIGAILETIVEALRLPYAALGVTDRDVGGLEIIAERGQAPVGSRAALDGAFRVPPPFESLPLSYQGGPIGTLIIARRDQREELSSDERRLLEAIAYQAAVVIEALQLSDNLQRARRSLVATREEERRRLRRDLHDGLGPAMAAQLLNLGSARALLEADPAAADAVLADMEHQTEASMSEVRRLVYGLRPPELDQQGLLGAIGASISEYEQASDHPSGQDDQAPLKIELQAPDRLPELPAAVEIAAYRIVREALLNVVRHARATSCVVRLESASALLLEITDDGIGCPARSTTGVGMTSMRERAVELGGEFEVGTRPSGGTQVTAVLPLRLEELE